MLTSLRLYTHKTMNPVGKNAVTDPPGTLNVLSVDKSLFTNTHRGNLWRKIMVK